MPGFLEDTGYDATTTIQLKAGYWVEVKNCLSREELKAAEQLLTNATVDSSGTTTMKPDVANYRDAMVTASIVAWNLTQPDGRTWALAPEKVKRANVGRIPGPLFNLIWQKIDELNGKEPEEQQAQFRDGPDAGDPAREAGAAGVAEVSVGDGAVEAPGDAAVGPGFASVA